MRSCIFKRSAVWLSRWFPWWQVSLVLVWSFAPFAVKSARSQEGQKLCTNTQTHSHQKLSPSKQRLTIGCGRWRKYKIFTLQTTNTGRLPTVRHNHHLFLAFRQLAQTPAEVHQCPPYNPFLSPPLLRSYHAECAARQPHCTIIYWKSSNFPGYGSHPCGGAVGRSRSR